jgi:hypothetical protein
MARSAYGPNVTSFTSDALKARSHHRGSLGLLERGF